MNADELRDLYQEVILDHAKKPRNFGITQVENCRQALGHNPMCGDRFTVSVGVEDGVVSSVAFEGEGCAISKASASLMTEALKGKSVENARALFNRFHELVTGKPPERAESASTGDRVELGKLAVFAGVCDYPARVKCASLAWHTLNAALDDGAETTDDDLTTVSTE